MQAHAKGVILCEKKACCWAVPFKSSFYLHASFETMLFQQNAARLHSPLARCLLLKSFS